MAKAGGPGTDIGGGHIGLVVTAIALAIAIPVVAGLLLQWCLRAAAPHSVLLERARPEEVLVWIGGALALGLGAVVRTGFPETPLGTYLCEPNGSSRAVIALLCTLFLLSIVCELQRQRPRAPRPRRRA